MVIYKAHSLFSEDNVKWWLVRESFSEVMLLVSYCCLTNYHKHSDLKPHPFVSLRSLGHNSTGSSAQCQEAEFKVLAGLNSHLESPGKICFQANSDHWLNSVHWSWRTEIPISLLSVSQGSHSVPRAACILSHVVPYIFNTVSVSNPSQVSNLWLPPLQPAVENSAFKGFAWLDQFHPG